MSEPKKKPTWAEVFAALDKEPWPDDFPSRDMSPPQERPELDKMFDESVEEPEPMTDEDCE